MLLFSKSHVAVNSKRTLSIFDLKIVSTVFSQVGSFTVVIFLPFLRVSTFKWWASSAIKTTLVFLKSSKVILFSYTVVNLVCNP